MSQVAMPGMSAPSTGGAGACPLCDSDAGALVWRGAKLRVIHAQEAGFPAFYRVIWADHVAEFSDLSPADRQHCMEAVTLVEQALREQLAPAKINLASLGNVVPHLHWHVIARYEWDSHFPAPVWAHPQRECDTARETLVAERLPALHALMRERLGRWADLGEQ